MRHRKVLRNRNQAQAEIAQFGREADWLRALIGELSWKARQVSLTRLDNAQNQSELSEFRRRPLPKDAVPQPCLLQRRGVLTRAGLL